MFHNRNYLSFRACVGVDEPNKYYQASVNRSTIWSDNQVLSAAALNGEFNNLLNALNIVNADISASAAIVASKISFGGTSNQVLTSNGSGGLSYVSGPTGTIIGSSDTQTLSNKRITRRLVATTQSATPAINTDNTDIANITGLAQAITSMTSSLSGTPIDGDLLEVRITDNGTARAITWGASFGSTNVTLPITTVISTMLRIGLEWNATASLWQCIAIA